MDPTCDLLWLVPDGYGCVTAVRVFRAGTWSRQPGAKHHLSVWLDGEFATVHAADCRALAPGAAFVRDGLPMYAAAPPRSVDTDVLKAIDESRWAAFSGVTVANNAPFKGILADDGGADEPVVVGG